MMGQRIDQLVDNDVVDVNAVFSQRLHCKEKDISMEDKSVYI